MQQKIKEFLDFGPFSLDISDRTLFAGKQELNLSPRAFDLLQCFATNPGALISREQLKASVWAAASISDNSIDQKIAELRKVFAQVDPTTEYIQNKHGQGWRFLGVVEKRKEAADAAAHESQKQGWWKGSYAVAILGVALLIGALLKIAGALSSGPYVIDYRQLTNDGFPKEGRLLTDGQLVYFAEHTSFDATSELRIASASISGNDTRYLPTTARPTLLFDMTKWAGDLTYWIGVKSDTGSMFLWKLRQNSLEATGLRSDGVSISPDGRMIVYSDSGTSLYIRDVTGASTVRSVAVPGYPNCFRWSVDGKRIRFSVCEAFSQTCRLWEVGSDGRKLQQLPFSPDRGKALSPEGWTADGRYFIYSELGEIDQVSILWIVRDGFNAKPVRLTTAPMSFRSAVAAPNNSAIFAIGVKSRNELVRFDLQSHAFVPLWDGFPAIDVTYSNDGSRAAFSRYPDRTLWVSNADGSERTQITSPPLEANQPHWSPDARRIAFMGHMPGKHWQIYVMEAAGGTPQALKPDDPFDQGVPSWSADGRFLVFGELRNRKPDKEMVIRVLNVTTNKESVLDGSKGKWSPRWSPDGRYILAQTTDFKELDLFDCDTKSWRVLVRQPSNDATWSLDGKFVHFEGTTEEGRVLFRVRVGDGKVERLVPQPDFDYSWSGVAGDGSPLTLRALKSEEIYALDLKLP